MMRMMCSTESDGESEDSSLDMALLRQRFMEVEDTEAEHRLEAMVRAADNWKAGRCAQHTVIVLDDWVRRLRHASNGRLLCGTYSGAAVLVDVESGEELGRWPSGDDAEVTALDFDGHAWAAGDRRGAIRVRRAAGKWGCARHSGAVSGLCFHRELLFSASIDKRITCWDLSQTLGSEHAPVELPEVSSLITPSPSLCLSASENYVAVGLACGDVLLCTLSPLRILLRFTAADAAISAIHLVTKSQLVCGSADGRVHLWRLDESEESGRRHVTFDGHKAPVVSVCGDGGKIVSGSRDGTIRVNDISRGSLRFVLQGFTAYLGSVEISPTWLIADGTNNAIVKLDFAALPEDDEATVDGDD